MFFVPLIITLLATVLAQPQVLPARGVHDPTPSLTTANFAKTTKKISGTKTKVDDDKGVTTKIINRTVTTGYRSGKSKPALVTGKLAGIIIAAVVGTIIILVIAILIYKRRQKKRAATQQSEEETDGAGNDEKDVEVGAGPIVRGKMTYTSQPANLHSDHPGTSIPEQPKVVGPGADRAVVNSNK